MLGEMGQRQEEGRHVAGPNGDVGDRAIKPSPGEPSKLTVLGELGSAHFFLKGQLEIF